MILRYFIYVHPGWRKTLWISFFEMIVGHWARKSCQISRTQLSQHRRNLTLGSANCNGVPPSLWDERRVSVTNTHCFVSIEISNGLKASNGFKANPVQQSFRPLTVAALPGMAMFQVPTRPAGHVHVEFKAGRMDWDGRMATRRKLTLRVCMGACFVGHWFGDLARKVMPTDGKKVMPTP